MSGDAPYLNLHLTCSLCIVLLSTATQRRHACNESLDVRLRYGEHPSEKTVLPMDSFRTVKSLKIICSLPSVEASCSDRLSKSEIATDS